MVRRQLRENSLPFLFVVGLVGWIVPGGGYFLLKETKRALIICATIVLMFGVGVYIGSIGVIDPIGARLWYIVQLMNSPFVATIGRLTAGGGYPVFGRQNEMGQIYTSISGLLNLLCIVNSVYLAYVRKAEPGER